MKKLLAVLSLAMLLAGCSNEFKPTTDKEKNDVAKIKEKYPEAIILDYEVAKKETKAQPWQNRDFKDCITDQMGGYFIKMSNGEIIGIRVYTNDKIEEKSLKDIKVRFPECFHS